MINKRQMSQGSKVNVNVGDDESTTMQSLFVEYQYTLLQKEHLSFAAACSQKNSKLYCNRSEETLT